MAVTANTAGMWITEEREAENQWRHDMTMHYMMDTAVIIRNPTMRLEEILGRLKTTEDAVKYINSLTEDELQQLLKLTSGYIPKLSDVQLINKDIKGYW